MSAFRKFVWSFSVSVMALTVAYLGAFLFQFGAPVAAEWWIPAMRVVKVDLARKAPPGAVIVASGSNSLFGIDSTALSQRLGRPVVNIATHAALPLDQLLLTVEETAKRGDLVVMPLEWTYLTRDYRIASDWAVVQTLAWNREYFDSMSLRRKMEFFASVSPKTVAENFITKLKRNSVYAEHPGRRVEDRAVILAKFATGKKEGGYSYMNIDDRGDILGTCGGRGIQLDDPFRYDLPHGAAISAPSLEAVISAAHRLGDKGVDVVIAFPPIAHTKITDSPGFRDDMHRLEAQLRASGLKVVGKQDDYYFPAATFYDSPYHLNCEARSARTSTLARDLLASGLTVAAGR